MLLRDLKLLAPRLMTSVYLLNRPSLMPTLLSMFLEGLFRVLMVLF